MPTSREQLKLRNTNLTEDGKSTMNETTDGAVQLPLPHSQESSKEEEMTKSGISTPKYIKLRKPADPFLQPKRASTAATRSLSNKTSESSPLDLIRPSNDKSPASALATLLSQTNLKDGCKPCSQCEASRAALDLSRNQMKDQEILHRLKIEKEKEEHRENAVLWEEEHNKLLEAVSKAAIKSSICEHLHMDSSEHDSIVDDFNKEIEALYHQNWELECEIEELKGRLMKYEPDFVQNFEAEETQVEDSISEPISLPIQAGDVDISSPGNQA